MPLERKANWTDRANFWDSLTPREIDSLAGCSKLKLLQTDAPVKPGAWKHINGFFARRPDVTLRLYSFYDSLCDLSFLPELPDLRRFAADCLMSIQGLEHLSSMNLKSLEIGVYELDSFDFLNCVSPRLAELTLGQTKSKRPSLELLARFRGLQKLSISHTKDIDAVGKLPELRELMLFSMSHPEVDFVRGLRRLQTVYMRRCGIPDLAALPEVPGIRHLELWWSRGLCDLAFLARMHGLRALRLYEFNGITRIPDLSGLTQLRRAHISGLNDLRDIRGIRQAPVLSEFTLYGSRRIPPSQVNSLLRMPRLKELEVSVGDRKLDAAFELRRDRAGIGPVTHKRFGFI